MRSVPRLSAVAVLLALLFGFPADSGFFAQSVQPAGITVSERVNRPEQQHKPYLILLSFDGLRADYLDRFDLPNFRRVLRRGARARSLRPVFPSLTFPNHYSLVTGLRPEHHGIVHNVFYDPDRKESYSFRDNKAVTDGSWYGGEPIWVTAEKQGMIAACFFWPGSEAAIKGVRPTIWNTYNGRIPNQERVETVLNWLRLPPERQPHLITAYFSELDSASHEGPLEGPAIPKALRSLDATLGALLDGIESLPIRDRIYLLLTSDHGMVETSAPQTLLVSSLVDTSAVKVGFIGPLASLHVSGGREEAHAVRDRINAKLKNGRAYLRDEVPERYAYRDNSRIGDVVIVMDEGWTVVVSPLSKLRILQSWGQHGWDPDLQSMRAMFAITGPGIRQGVTIPDVENVDIYPLMTELLGLSSPEAIDGRPGHIRQLVME